MKINHNRILISALRTSIIFIASFLTYDILKNIENTWNKKFPHKKSAHFRNKKIIHFLFIFLLDIILLYLFFYLLKEEL